MKWFVLIGLLLAGCGRSRTDACADACARITELSLAGVEDLGDPELAKEVKQSLAREDASGMAAGTQHRRCIQRCRAERLDTGCVMAAKTVEAAMTCPFRKPE